MEFLSGLFGIIIFVLDIYAIVRIINSRATTGMKIVWVLVVAILPLVGLIAWYFAGPKS